MTEHNQPLAEVFGRLITDQTSTAVRYRKNRLCPFNNKVPNCTKDKAKNPLGVCSIYHNDDAVITCPIRFRQDWIITDHAAEFFFSPGATWSSLTEVRLNDNFGKSAGNIDIVLVAYDETGKIYDFGSLEVQAVYISGNVRTPFEHFMKQELLFPHLETYHRPYPKAVNVASVPQRSPFRYPGGKTWFVPTFRKWIANMPSPPRLLVEPFAGGGIISLTALFEKLVQKAIMVERDEEIAAVWQSVVNGDAEWLADRILEFRLTKENVLNEINKDYDVIKHIAFQTNTMIWTMNAFSKSVNH